MEIDEKQLAKDLKPLLDFFEHNALNVRLSVELKKKYPFLETKQRCGYCLFNVDFLSKPAHIRDSAGQWTESTYLLCPRCREHLRGHFKYAKKP